MLEGKNHQSLLIDETAWKSTLLSAQTYGEWKPRGSIPPRKWGNRAKSVSIIDILPVRGFKRFIVKAVHISLNLFYGDRVIWDSAEYYRPVGQTVGRDDAQQFSLALQRIRENPALKEQCARKMGSPVVFDELIHLSWRSEFTIRNSN
jgi:hypothetical protein